MPGEAEFDELALEVDGQLEALQGAPAMTTRSFDFDMLCGNDGLGRWRTE